MAIALPTADDVRAIIETDKTDPQIEAIIADAALIAKACIADLDADVQKAIVKWLTAHLIASSASGIEGGAQITSMKLGDASESYARASMGAGLAGTSYGQQALALDPNGCLAQIGMRRAYFKVL
jgi:hypothetical protein